MAKVHPAVYWVTAGAVGGMMGSSLLSKVSPFWAWSIAGLIMGGIILAGNEKLRKNFVLGGLGLIVVAVASGALATLVYRL